MKINILSISKVFLFITAVALTSCGGKSSKEAEEGEHHEEHENTNVATLSADQAKSIGLKLGSIEKKQLTSSLKANGILKVPNQNKATATAALGGTIKTINVQTGNSVRKGQVLATLTNPTFISLQEEFLSIGSKLKLAETEFKRQQELQAGNAGALKNFQQAEADLNMTKARRASLQKQLELLGIATASLTPENIRNTINIVSPINGAVSNVMVSIGSYVDPSTPIAEIIDNSQLHLDLFVYEKDLTKLQVGQTIHFTLTNNAGQEYDAQIFGISNTFEQNTKAIAVHATVQGNKTGLIDGMSITALVSLEKATVDAVPTDAIISAQGQDYIFVVTDKHAEAEHEVKEDAKADEHGHQHGAEEKEESKPGEITFERVAVRKGTSDVGYSEITPIKEIPMNSRIAVKGAFFIQAKMSNTGGHEH